MNRSSLPSTSARPRFLADAMLGRLAKWLRLLGYDTLYAHDLADAEILGIAETDGRVVLTRDTLLIRRKRCRNFIFIMSDHWREQLKQVFVEAGLSCDEMLTICAHCNRRLRPVDKESVESLVPPYVYRTQERFFRCDGCSRIFWSATHVKHIVEELSNLKEGA